MPLGIGRKKGSGPANGNVFVDLSETEVPRDVSAMWVKILKVIGESDILEIPNILSTGCILIVNTEAITEDKERISDRIMSAARISGCECRIINSSSAVIVPKGVNTKIFTLGKR